MATQQKRQGEPKQQRLVERPQLILEAAIPIIGERGYYGFSIKDIAERCGLTVPGILHHFGSKEGILLAVIEDREARDAEAVWQDVFENGLAGFTALSLDDIKRRLHETVVRNSQQPEILRFYSVLRIEALYPLHPAFEFFQTRQKMATELLTQAFTGKLNPPAAAARLLMATMTGLENLWLEQHMEFDLVAEWDHAADRILT